jgi:predicted RNase H-like nuclease
VRALESAVVTPPALAARLAGLGTTVVCAVDAPLVLTPGRHAERALARVFGRYRASAYFASEAFLGGMGGMAGPLLAAELTARGFNLDPAALPEREDRVAFEMYPHAAHVVLFGLDRILGYKKGPIEGRRTELRRYQAFLRVLLLEERVDPGGAAGTALAATAASARGLALKDLEDRLDALTCALVARRAWRLGPPGVAVFGCAPHGAILTPGLPAGVTAPPDSCPLCAQGEREATSGRGRSSP